MRNIEALKNYFLGKDPQLKETMADNSLRLIGIPGREFVLRAELMRRLKILRDELVEKDQELADKIDEAVAEMERVAASIPFTMLDSDLHIYQDQPMSPLWESGWYNTGEYKVYWADTVEPIAFEHTLFYYNNTPGETYLEFMPETFVDNWNLLKLYLYWDEDEQEWFPESIGIDDFIAENSSGIPTSSAVRTYVQNNVIHHLQAPVAAASDLSQGLYVADSDLRLVTAYEQVQLNSGDFIVAQASTSTPGEVNLIIIQSDKIKTGTYSTMDGHLTTTDYDYIDPDDYYTKIETDVRLDANVKHITQSKAASTLTYGLHVSDGAYSITSLQSTIMLKEGDLVVVSKGTGLIPRILTVIKPEGITVGTVNSQGNMQTKNYLYVYNAESTDNKVTSISSSSDDTEYPSAKAVYDATQNFVNGNGNSFSVVNTIWTGTQAEYDLLTPDANTLYFIKE